MITHQLKRDFSMKKLHIITLLLLTSFAFAQEAKMGLKMPSLFQAVSPQKASILQEGEEKMFCPQCAMTLPMFYKTNHSAHANNKTEQYCSIHCLAKTIAEGTKVSDIKVVDNTSLKFIDALTASYVVGSSKRGTMSKVSKYAFAKKADAEIFAKEFGGEILNFADTLRQVRINLSKENAMVAKRQAMMAKKGEMIYSKKCQASDKKFMSITNAKAYLSKENPCGMLNGKQQQAIALYLFSRQK